MPESETRLLRIRDVLARVGIGRSVVYEVIRRGTFPAPHHPSPGVAVWRSDEIAAWIDRAAPRDGREAA